MTTLIYLAGPYEARDVIAGEHFAGSLDRVDSRCVSSWLTEEHEINEGTTGPATKLDDATVSGHALDDLVDINSCDVFVLITANQLMGKATTSGGRHVETGYALAKGKHIIVLGEPENIFHRIASGPVERADSWHDVLLAIQRFQIRTLREAAEVSA